jgi:photosystem II stability/assembly factor-like uncharacterized protein
MKSRIRTFYRILFYIFFFSILFGLNSCKNPEFPKQNKQAGCVINTSSNPIDTLVSGTKRDLYCVNMLNPGVGYISGENGVILKTLNGGNNWFAQSSGTGNDLKGIFALDEDSAISVGADGLIIRTTDKGSTWDSVSAGTAQDLNSVFFPKKDTGYVCGNGGVILKSVDGGRNWSSQVTGTVNNLYCINFVGRDTGVAIGGNGTILQTINGGTSWMPQVSPAGATDLYGLDFIDAKGMAVGASGKIIRTLNYGTTWDTVSSPTALRLNSIVWCQQQIAYAVGENGVTLRYNGTNWAVGPQGTANDLNFIHAPFWKNPDVRVASAFAVGDGGTIVINNPDTCNNIRVELTYIDSCGWCLRLNMNGQTTNYTHFVFTATTQHSNDWCDVGPPTEMNVIGHNQYENTGQITDVSFNGANSLEIKVSDFNSSAIFPVNFRFYLYNQVIDNSCYIELDDIICCNKCE